MLRALYSGISGMKVNQTKMDVIGNNIANVGTTSFKGATVRFEDMLSQNVSEAMAPGRLQGGTNPKQVGLGVQLGGMNTDMSQGMMQPTGRNLDVAMDGDGYLMVAKSDTMFDDNSSVVVGNDPANSVANHTVTNAQGAQIMYTRDGSLTLDSQGNLLTADGNRVLGYSITDGTNTSIESTADAANNPLGTIHFVDANSANLNAVGTGGAGSTSTDSNKYLKTLRIPDQVYDDAAKNPDGSTGKFVRIKTFSIEKDGTIKGVLEDGRVSVLGQIAVSSFKNPEALSNLGKNLYQSSANSGVPVVKTGLGAGANDNSKGYGDMNQGMLEMSNVDLASQFTDMIVTSRAFQANSKTIQTGDEILQDILNLKR